MPRAVADTPRAATSAYRPCDPAHLPHAAAVVVSAAALLAAWGVFVTLNRRAEELEPESMEAAKQEDLEVQAIEGGSSDA